MYIVLGRPLLFSDEIGIYIDSDLDNSKNQLIFFLLISTQKPLNKIGKKKKNISNYFHL